MWRGLKTAPYNRPSSITFVHRQSHSSIVNHIRQSSITFVNRQSQQSAISHPQSAILQVLLEPADHTPYLSHLIGRDGDAEVRDERTLLRVAGAADNACQSRDDQQYADAQLCTAETSRACDRLNLVEGIEVP